MSVTLGYMTKTLNQIFFFLHQNQNIFFINIGNQNIFLEKKHNPPPPLQVKWSFPYKRIPYESNFTFISLKLTCSPHDIAEKLLCWR
jgi:hypothetical protein